MTTTKEDYYIGVDVGTGSVRVSLFSSDGRRVASNEQQIQTWRSPSDHRIFEQSTDNIWSCTCFAIRECLSQTALEKENVKGVGFDATCSLAVTDFNGEPILISSGQYIGTIGERNVVLWADHRAEKESEVINATGSVVLDYVGGKMSVGPALLILYFHV
jgi:ribulose kinase